MEFGWLFVIIFAALVILGIIHLISLISGGKGTEPLEASPIDIIKRRYAKGEITREDFQRMKSDLLKD